MKKSMKVLGIILSTVLLLAGCGGKTQNNMNQSQNDDNKEVIEFSPAYVAIDDTNLKLEVTSISRELTNLSRETNVYVYRVNCILTNKNEKYGATIGIPVGDGYVGQYAVTFSSPAGGVQHGKIDDSYSFSFYGSDDPSSKWNDSGAEHVSSLNDLLNFNATLRVQIYEDKDNSRLIHDTYRVEVSLEDAKQK